MKQKQRVFGESPEYLGNLKGRSPQVIAAEMLIASRGRGGHVGAGRNGRIAKHLKYWAPGLFDFLLSRRANR
jgi:hypothetical protein